MQLSIGRLAAVLITLLVLVTAATTAANLYVLQKSYRTLEQQQEAEANDTVHNAATAIRNQIRFYQGILHLLSQTPTVANIAAFGDTDEIAAWSRQISQMLPGVLGIALASPDGTVHGDPLALRLGPTCQADMQKFQAGKPMYYPLLHADIKGLEHFDLLARVGGATASEPAETLFVSFRLSVLEELLSSMTTGESRFDLLDQNGVIRLSVGRQGVPSRFRRYEWPIPDTPWHLVLHWDSPVNNSVVHDLIAVDVVVVGVVALVMLSVVRMTHRRFVDDMERVHRTLIDVLNANYEAVPTRTGIKEVGLLYADIERLAIKLQTQRNELRHQSLSDPLTGAFNRRYFDLMLAHLHELSRRQPPAILVIIDLNDFKHINDEFGHATGDRVLSQTAAFLRSSVRSTDIVARLGGDEFALLLHSMADDALEQWLKSLVSTHQKWRSCDNIDAVEVSHFSMGAASIDAERYASPAQVFDAADRAMYSAKQSGGVRASRFAIADHQPTPKLMTKPDGR